MIRKQAIFDAAVQGLNEQKAFSAIDGNQCQYRSPNGNKCAVGFLIPEGNYDPKMEGKSAGSHHVGPFLYRKFTDGHLTDDDEAFLTVLQEDLHDDPFFYLNGEWDQKDFEQRVEAFAKAHNLKNPLEG